MRVLLLLAALGLAAVCPARAAEPLDGAAPLAKAIEKAFGPDAWAEVKVSTNGPAADLTRLVKEGFYKREMIELILMSSRSGKPLKDLAKKRKKGETLTAIAAGCRLDHDRVYGAALAVEEIVDRDYLPRFPEKRPRIVREE